MNASLLKNSNKLRNCIQTMLLPFVVLSFLMSCNVSESNVEVDSLEFEKMQIQYIKLGGWINTSTLDILPSGEATAKEVSHASTEILNQKNVMLSENQKIELSKLFASFQKFKRHYTPAKFYTDQNTYTFILSYEDRIDTVSVYDPSRATLPKDLKQLISTIENFHQSIINGN